MTQPGNAPKARPSHLTTADEVNKISEGLAFEDRKGRVLRRMQTLNWDTFKSNEVTSLKLSRSITNSQVVSHQNSDSTRIQVTMFRLHTSKWWWAMCGLHPVWVLPWCWWRSPRKLNKRLLSIHETAELSEEADLGHSPPENLFHSRFPVHKVWGLTVQIQVDSAPLIGYTMKRRQTGRQSLRVNSLQVRWL